MQTFHAVGCVWARIHRQQMQRLLHFSCWPPVPSFLSTAASAVVSIMQTFCHVGSFWAHTHLWQMQRLQCWWLTCWLLTRATPAASFPSCTSYTARPLMHTRYHPWSCYNIPRYALYAMMGCLPFLLHCLPQGHVCTAAYIFILQPQSKAHRHLFGLNALHQHAECGARVGDPAHTDKQALVLLLALRSRQLTSAD